MLVELDTRDATDAVAGYIDDEGFVVVEPERKAGFEEHAYGTVTMSVFSPFN